jgi:hypothetical protein
MMADTEATMEEERTWAVGGRCAALDLVAAANGDEFGIGVFDDPFVTDGDRSDHVLTSGVWGTGTVPEGIVTRCPGGQPSPIRYEWQVPLSALGITPGGAHTFGFAIAHPGAAHWPTGVTTVDAMEYPTDPAQWSAISSTALWHQIEVRDSRTDSFWNDHRSTWVRP